MHNHVHKETLGRKDFYLGFLVSEPTYYFQNKTSRLLQ